MPVARDVRRATFARFVGRALQSARDRGMTVKDIEAATGVGKTTFYRWRDGDWTEDPRGSQVAAFCEGLGIPVETAYDALGWTAARPASAQAAPLMEPDVERLLRKLEDPNVPEDEKRFIRESIRMLANRPSPGAPGRRRSVS
jgi:hypothetical protein